MKKADIGVALYLLAAVIFFIVPISSTLLDVMIAIITSNKVELIGTMKKITAASKYNATPMSAFFMPFPP